MRYELSDSLAACGITLKCKLTYRVILVLTALAIVPSLASNIVFAHDHGTSYQSPPASNYSYVVAGKSITPKDQGNPAGTESGNEDGPQIRQAPDATMNASVIPADQAIFTLIAILLLMVKGTIPLSQDPPRQTLFHQILFRVIISPNAP